jgi:hypothetical protein
MTNLQFSPGLAEDAFMPRLGMTRSQTLLGLFMAILLCGALVMSATVVIACAGLSSCHDGVNITTSDALSLPLYGART